MPYVVEIQIADGDLTERMSRMRTWLDRQRFEPSSFRRLGSGERPHICRVSFETDREATAFAQEFGGQVL